MTPEEIGEKFEKDFGCRSDYFNHRLGLFMEMKQWIIDQTKQAGIYSNVVRGVDKEVEIVSRVERGFTEIQLNTTLNTTPELLQGEAVEKGVSGGDCYCNQFCGYEGVCVCSNGMSEADRA